jgi:hypothetical protein
MPSGHPPGGPKQRASTASQGAAGGDQASFVQAQLAKQGGNCPPSPY